MVAGFIDPAKISTKASHGFRLFAYRAEAAGYCLNLSLSFCMEEDMSSLTSGAFYFRGIAAVCMSPACCLLLVRICCLFPLLLR